MTRAVLSRPWGDGMAPPSLPIAYHEPMVARWRVVAMVAVLVGAFCFLLTAVMLQWNVWSWPGLAAAVAVIGLVSWLAEPRRRVGGEADLYASDPYSDAYLGRNRPIAPHHDPAPISQIDDRPQDQQLRLPPRDSSA